MHITDIKGLTTLRDLLRYGVSELNRSKAYFGHGSYSAWDEAVYLLLHTLDLPLDTLEPFLDAKVTDTEKKLYFDRINRRCNDKVPSAYITGEAWLQGYRFYVDERVIIPRSPISELLAEQLYPWVANPEEIESGLDLCTGSGCLAILMAIAFEHAHIDAVDLSSDALEIANLNIQEYGLSQRVTTIQGDLFNALGKRKYQIIVSNPPYVNMHSMGSLPKEYSYEPDIALRGGMDGMDTVRQILKNAPHYLHDEGILILEIGNEYDNFIKAFPNLEALWLSTEAADNQIMMLTKDQLLK